MTKDCAGFGDALSPFPASKSYSRRRLTVAFSGALATILQMIVSTYSKEEAATSQMPNYVLVDNANMAHD